jgi:GntR family transcriptional regulator
MLYPGNGKPLFGQLKDLILQWVDTGELKTGDKLPSERVLSEDYNISRITVRQALNDLVQEGVITKRHGKGYYVAPPRKIEYRLDSLLGFIEEFTIKKMRCEITILRREFITPPDEVRTALDIRNNAKVFLLTRLIIVEGEPLGIDYTYLPANVARLLDGLSLDNSILYQFFEKNGFKLITADQWICAEKPSREEAKLLRTKESDPVLVIYRNTRVAGDVVLDNSRTVYRADRYHYFVTLKRYPTVSHEDKV